MTTAYYLAPIMGDGLTPETAYRADVPSGYADCGAYIPSNLDDGSPLNSWALVDITADDHAPFQAALTPLPVLAPADIVSDDDASTISSAVASQTQTAQIGSTNNSSGAGSINAAPSPFQAGMTMADALAAIQSILDGAP